MLTLFLAAVPRSELNELAAKLDEQAQTMLEAIACCS